jgi:DNA-binding NarL/FixJ family response regulator
MGGINGQLGSCSCFYQAIKQFGPPMRSPDPRVLLVDDEPRFRAQLRQILTAYGIVLVAEAGSGPQAANLARQPRPAVVLMDLLIPDMDGLTATRLLLDRLPSTGVIILSAYDDPTLRYAAQQAGAAAYLAKGCLARQAADTINQVATDRAGQEQPSSDRLDAQHP